MQANDSTPHLEYMQRFERGCGHRKVGGNYIMGGGLAVPCYRLPMPIPICPACGDTIEFFRGIRRINAREMFGDCTDDSHKCHHDARECYACFPPEKAWVMWVGEKYYTMASFAMESYQHGVSKRIAVFPDEMEVGDKVFLAYKKCFNIEIPPEERVGRGKWRQERWEPGIFYAFTVTGMQKVMDHKKALNPQEIANVIASGVTPVVEYDDPDEVTSMQEQTETDEFRKSVLKCLDRDTVQTSIDDDDSQLPPVKTGGLRAVVL